MIPVQIRFTKKVVENIDRILIESGIYSTRSELIRDATRRFIIELEENMRRNVYIAQEKENWQVPRK